MNIAIVDGQGGGLGKALIIKIRKEIEEEIGIDINICALGTNPVAVSNMLRVGADAGVVGEKNMLKYFEETEIDYLVGPIGMICVGGINGEITEKIATSIFRLGCKKYVIPLKRHGIFIAGTTKIEVKQLLQDIIDEIKGDMEAVNAI